MNKTKVSSQWSVVSSFAALWLLAIGYCVCAAAAAGTLRTTVTLTWDYPAGDADVFKLYSTTNLTGNLSTWPVIAVIGPTNRSVTLSNLVAQQCWFYITASNWWGESVPSNTAGTPQPPSGGSNLRIGP